ncbi:hypothetical protein CYMTET_33908 [Cymbomonas tetramitiformis]|uniref:LEM domain-containing protein n=1 Tax=Cymbomonas tetramitiformis TaxID=36881 RepID=A0AAE0FC98_9CHLO|nr:hypothetical protein CYMTET_33908 [Cymbomonas tetramitiformis]
MAKSSAGRHAQRVAKRLEAKATRTTKFTNQKGGGKQTVARKGTSIAASAIQSSITSHGVPLHAIPELADKMIQSSSEAEQHDEAEEEEQETAEKKVRAIQKKLRQIDQLKQKPNLNEEQQLKLLSEDELKQELERLLPSAVGPVQDFPRLLKSKKLPKSKGNKR